jgi:hypothetical protein
VLELGSSGNDVTLDELAHRRHDLLPLAPHGTLIAAAVCAYGQPCR